MIEAVSGENKNLKKISGVTFGALQFKGYKIREKIEDDESVTKNKVFSVEFFVDKPTFKEIKKSYKKITTEEIDSSDIERRFHIPVPIEGEDEQYKVTFYAQAERKNKKGETMELWKDEFMGLNLRPKIYDKSTGENITSNFYLQNGAKGDIYFQEAVNDKHKYTHAYIVKVELDSYEPYVKQE